MRRLLGVSLAAAAALLLLGLFTGSARAATLNCSEPEAALCAETADSIGYGGEYTGHALVEEADAWVAAEGGDAEGAVEALDRCRAAMMEPAAAR